MTQLHEGETRIDEDIVRALVAEQFPEWSHLELSLVPSSGTVNLVYRLGDSLCLRIPRLKSFEESLQRELEWLPIFKSNLTVQVPAPIAAGRPGCGYPFIWAIYGWLEGTVLDPTNLPCPSATVAEVLAQFVSELNRLTVAGGPRSRRDFPMRAREDFAQKAIGALEGRVDVDLAHKAWNICRSAPECENQLVWTHGDLLPPNLLVQGGTVSAVIDFGNSGIGDPAVDIIAAWSVLENSGRSAFRTALQIDEGVWARSRGFALFQALMGMSYYWETNPSFAKMANRTFDQVVEDIGL